MAAIHQQHIQEEDEEVHGPMEVARLESCGVNTADVVKLKAGGFHTGESVGEPIYIRRNALSNSGVFLCLEGRG